MDKEQAELYQIITRVFQGVAKLKKVKFLFRRLKILKNVHFVRIKIYVIVKPQACCSIFRLA
jgi:hypothetical protein